MKKIHTPSRPKEPSFGLTHHVSHHKSTIENTYIHLCFVFLCLESESDSTPSLQPLIRTELNTDLDHCGCNTSEIRVDFVVLLRKSNTITNKDTSWSCGRNNLVTITSSCFVLVFSLVIHPVDLTSASLTTSFQSSLRYPNKLSGKKHHSKETVISLALLPLLR